MKYNFVIILLTCAMMGCQSQQGDQAGSASSASKQDDIKPEMAFAPVKSFAVHWDWTEGNTVDGVLPTIQKQVPVIIDFWKKGIIENAYIAHETAFNAQEKFSNAFFIIKGKSEQEVKAILDQTPAYLAGITKYKLYPVGIKWLKRNKQAVQKAHESKNSFAVVWTAVEYNDKYEQYIGEQSTQILELWKEGVIENAYLDVEKAGKKDLQHSALIFFINAASREEAADILDELPFVNQQIAKYSLYSVGNFWMSTPEDI